MGWKKPFETTQCIGVGYRAIITFGEKGKEKTKSGIGVRQNSAIYEAYIKLIPIVIPKQSAIELMIKWVPGYKQLICYSDSSHSFKKHPKNTVFEWALKNNIAPPITIFSKFKDSVKNMKIWTAKVTFCGKTVASKASKKKDAERQCFAELVRYIMDGSIANN